MSECPLWALVGVFGSLVVLTLTLPAIMVWKEFFSAMGRLERRVREAELRRDLAKLEAKTPP
jgi:hypothetical protein